jgi:hypothetical protein
MQDYIIVLEISGSVLCLPLRLTGRNFPEGKQIRLQNATVQNHKVELTGKELTFRAYVSIENTGDSYNLKPLADNLDLTNFLITTGKIYFRLSTK